VRRIVPRARDQTQERTMYAVVSTGGKQYRIEAGSELTIERLAVDAGSSVTFDRVLLVGDGDTVTVGTPTVDGATVSATVLGDTLGPKLRIFKFKQKVKYRRTAGHRQHLTRVRIDEISAAGKTAKAEEAQKPAKASKADAPKAATEVDAAKPRRTRKPAAAKAAADGTATESAKPKRTRRPAATKVKADDAAKAEAEPETKE
jgi:large subunit ribosomal protein L21